MGMKSLTNRMGKLTRAQELVLRDLRTVPKKARTYSGLVRYEDMEHFDGRTLNALHNRGLIRYREYGLEVSK